VHSDVVSRIVPVALLLFCIPFCAPAAHPVRREPLMSLTELEERLETASGEEFTDAVSQATRLGPDYSWLLERLLEDDIATALVDRVCKALARNGDEASLLVLRQTAADTSRPWPLRDRAISALALARDRESIHLLQSIAVGTRSRILAAAAADAVARIEEPGRYRPLVEIENGVLFFNFLLDDLQAIEYTEPAGATHAFAESELRTICDLLQSGEVGDEETASLTGLLTFLLKDGSDVAVRVGGEVFGGVSGRSVRSPLLAEFIEERRAGRRSETGGPE